MKGQAVCYKHAAQAVLAEIPPRVNARTTGIAAAPYGFEDAYSGAIERVAQAMAEDSFQAAKQGDRDVLYWLSERKCDAPAVEREVTQKVASPRRYSGA